MQTYDVHLYKNLEQEKASQTFSICGGSFPELVSKLLIFQKKRLLNYFDVIGIVSDP